MFLMKRFVSLYVRNYCFVREGRFLSGHFVYNYPVRMCAAGGEMV